MLARVAEFAVALISAGAAILGAIVGGFMTARATAKIEDKRQVFQRDRDAAEDRSSQERELKLARATALALYPRYLAAASALSATLKRETFAGLRIAGIEEPASFEDRKLLAAHMSSQAQRQLIAGEHALRTMLETRKPSDEWTDDAAKTVGRVLELVDDAWKALRRFGEGN
jgi:hypothetical protein